ncbi:peptidoglycan DD-metalloendopeptidase family protein [Candidatus Thiothrix sp. Deng01]|uniref:Peptidoglycan DD-metalloendopeptidase family protein n=1 Tax=Candidatus Thiothrix phosphatis TaxID=3112415 RepID=A0ABU6CZ64_9GAMM|nr:peptidoglycan DD-metalloendopeptidase family protein [Candidatus Thiothrix sp. Deng01]MEB4591379.1 peptidoglycan DD-metalloendopeptidase family protein [Candidatus Thiothrix sp. Deng01]
MLSSNRRPFPEKKKKSWEEAIRHYNLPTGGIEINIPGDYKPKPAKSFFKPTPTNTKQEKKASIAPPTSPSAKKPLRYIATRSLLLTCGLATLGNIPVYSMISSPEKDKILSLNEPYLDKNSPAQIIKDLNLPAVAVESFSGYAVDVLPDATQGSWSMQTVADNDTLESIMGVLELAKTSKKLLEDPSIKQELKHLKTDAHILTQVVDGSLQQLIYAKDKDNAYVISATDEGFKGHWEKDILEVRNSKIAFSVRHSVQRDGKAAGLGSSLIRQLGQVFLQDVDFKRDIKAGDKVGLIFEDYRYQGESIYTDKILAAEYTSGKNTYQRIRFTLEDGKTDYFHPNGDTELKRTAFDRKPLDGRMSSGFGMRRHPVFGLFKSHTGTDFAAPRGTPIHATADGSVKFMGRQNGYGNVVELRHNGDITTLYGHMSAFREDLQSGDSVKRGDVIGYVGSTGTSTGNHVHYEFRLNGEPQNPMTVELPQEGIMTAEEIRQFKNLAADMTQQLSDLRKLASADSNKPASDQKGG